MCRSEEVIEREEEYRGYKIKLVYDSDITSPRKDFDQMGTFILWSRKYQSPDDNPYGCQEVMLNSLSGVDDPYYLEEKPNQPDFEVTLYKCAGRWRTEEEVREYQWKKVKERYYILGVDVFPDWRERYKVSGRLDLDCDGYIYAEKKYIESETPDPIAYLKGEVAEYSAWSEGNIVGYRITDRWGEETDSCWGFYPETDKQDEFEYVILEARSVVDYYHKQQLIKSNYRSRKGSMAAAREVANA